MITKKKVCMIVQDPMVKGGIAAVVNGYRGSQLERDNTIIYVESYTDGGKFKKIIKSIKGYLQFLKVLLLDKPDLIHIHSSFGPSFYRKIPFIYMSYIIKKPIINHIHGADFESFYSNASNKKKNLIKKIYNKCDILVALSEEWKERLEIIAPKVKIKVIENYSVIYKNGLSFKENRALKNRVLFLGEIGKRKGCYDIPEVVEKVCSAIPDVEFILAGDGEVKALKKMLIQKKIEENVIFPGWVRGEEKENLLKESDIFFLPSYNEGMPMSILDAMGYGLPIITTNVGGIPKIVHNGKNGYSFDPGDINSFAKEIINILNDSNQLIKLSNESYNFVKENYSLETHIETLQQLYTNIGEKKYEKST